MNLTNIKNELKEYEGISFYENVIFYNGIFYSKNENIKSVSLHNRSIIPFQPCFTDNQNFLDTIISLNNGIILLDGFHSNMAHLLWDFMYPSWYGMFCYLNNKCNDDFQWMTTTDIDHQNGGWHCDILEKFSGNPITTLNIFKTLYCIPIHIPWLICGMNVGIGCVNKNLCVRRELTFHDIDPIETFVNRMYSRYNIQRNIITKSCCNIIYIINKRPQYGIESMFSNLQNIHKNYNFRIIDFSLYNFYEQLNILNNTCIIIVGVGTARANTPFLPNGAAEIQTNDYSIENKISYLDCHAGTLSKYIKIINIEKYSDDEIVNKKISHLLSEYIENSLRDIPYNTPIELENNLPSDVRLLIDKVNNNPQIFEQWRKSMSNDIGELLKIL